MDLAPSQAWEQRKQAARTYQPQRVRLLLVAEAPPDGDRYFYFEDVPEHDHLFLSVCEVLFEQRPARGDKTPWLKELRRRGVFLVDLKPSGPLVAGESLAPYVPWLVLTCQELEPEHIVLVKATVYDAACRALAAAGLPVVDVRVPFPASGQQVAFRREFRKAIVRAGLERLVRARPVS